MFTQALERVLAVAARESLARRHAELTVEHVLYAAAHDPLGEEILIGAGADVERLRKDLDGFLEDALEKLPTGSNKQPTQTLAFRRALQTAIVHVQSAGKADADVGDMLAAVLRETRSHGAALLGEQGVTRLDILNYISHGITRNPRPPREQQGPAEGGEGA